MKLLALSALAVAFSCGCFAFAALLDAHNSRAYPYLWRANLRTAALALFCGLLLTAAWGVVHLTIP